MATRETRLERGHRGGETIASRLVSELVEARRNASVSQAQLGASLHMSQAEVSRLERLVRLDDISVVRIAEAASLLGLELSANLYPLGDPIRDKGHQALIGRFRSRISDVWRITAEAPLPSAGDRRSWDLLLRIGVQVVGVEVETRLRDLQQLVRRVRERERDGGVDHILLVLGAGAHNRALLQGLNEMLGSAHATPPRKIIAALGAGTPLPGSGVVLL